MCHYQELARSSEGYIIRCNECRYYQVYFSGLILSLSPQEFTQWQGYIDRLNLPGGENGDPDERSAFISTPKEGVHMMVSANGYLQLQALIQRADDEVTALEMLALFED